MKELQSLALDVRVLDKNGEEIELSDLIDDDTPTMATLEEVEKAIDHPYVEEDDEDVAEDEDFEDDYEGEDEVYDDTYADEVLEDEEL